MSRRHNTRRDGLKLPTKLQQELGIELKSSNGSKKYGRHIHQNRKEQRKADRIEKRKARQHPSHKRNQDDREEIEISDKSDEEPITQKFARKQASTKASKQILTQTRLKSILKNPQPLPPSPIQSDSPSSSRASSPGLILNSSSNAFRERAAQDDAEIIALEKKLGLRNKKSTKSFEDDGLGDLLEGIDSDGESRKRKREGEEWLQAKRKRKKLEDHELVSYDDDHSDLEQSTSDEDFDNSQDLLDSGDSEGSSSERREASPVARKPRENPYIAPITANSTTKKYIPPSLRKISNEEEEILQRLRRQIQGLLNKLSEANLISIVTEVEKLYQTSPRQVVTSTLIDLLISLFLNHSSLQSTFVILHAGFVGALYKLIGTDFGAEMVSKLVDQIDKHLHGNTNSGKESNNLISFLSYLFVFHIISSVLVFDYTRKLLQELNETNTELLLKIVRDCGPQLRQEDPSALKEVVQIMQASAAKVTVDGMVMSIRTKFMIETITDLKNNKMKGATSIAGLTSEHVTRMRKILSSLNNRNLRATEPLRIGLEDIRNSKKKGKWWLVGASWKGDESGQNQPQDQKHINENAVRSETVNTETDLLELARQYRMNTAIRRSIFIAILSATDYQDAHLRLLKLRLKRSQEQEIPKVVIRCAGAETIYNPYYTLIAKKLCSEKRMKMAFQFVLWDFFKKMGEKGDMDESDDEDENQSVELSEIVNLAKLYGNLILDGCLTIGILKVLNLAFLKDQAKTFVELLFLSIFVKAGGTTDKRLTNIFDRASETPQLVQPLLYFIKTCLRKTDLAENETARVRHGCRVASEALNRIITSAMEPE